ncbi:MAG: NHL repeat-containing protein [Candidatus Krumholzibacteria bacterium]|nr:NHL repeat-containing protein [Candidatus Krumholzibacteria bacterium]
MKIHVLVLVIAAGLAIVSLVNGAERGGTTLVTPPWTHCLGLHKVTQFHLDIYSGYREKFNDPEGLFCIKLVSKDRPDNARDDDELTVYGVNSGAGDMIYNKSLTSIGIVGKPGGGPMQFREPQSLTGDKDGNLYVADTGNDRIVHLRYVGDEIVWVGEMHGLADSPLRSPSGVCLSGGSLYVADTGNDRIVVLSESGSFIKSFGLETKGASLFRPYAIAAVTEGDEFLYYGDHFLVVTDSLGKRLWKASPEGKPLGLVRRSEIGSDGRFDHAAIDYYANIYVTDREAGWIHKFDRHLTYITAIGAGRAGERLFDEPRGITIYRRFGQVFVSERAGAQYFWIGTDVLRFSADKLVLDPERKRCSVEASFILTECSTISLVLRDDRGRDRFTVLPEYILPAARFVRRIEVDCPDAAALAKCMLSLVIIAKPTYSSRSYVTIERESHMLSPRVSALPSAGSR